MKLLLSSTDLFDYPWVRLLALFTIGLIVLTCFARYVIKVLYSKAEAHEERVEQNSVLEQLEQDFKVSDEDPFS